MLGQQLPDVYLNKFIYMGRDGLQRRNIYLVAGEEDRKLKKTMPCLLANMTPRSESHVHREKLRETSRTFWRHKDTAEYLGPSLCS